MTLTKRNDTVDIIKALGIVLMVCGHCEAPFTDWLYMFHMAVFFMASGYCWNSRNADSIWTVWKYTKKKIKTLYVPYVVINSLFAILSNVFIKINIYTSNIAYRDMTGGFVVERSLRDIAYYVLRVVTLWNSEPMGGATWFISALFIITVFHCFAEYFLNKLDSAAIKKLSGAILVITLIIMAELINKRVCKIPFEHIVLPLFSGYIIYLLGILIRKKEDVLHKIPKGFDVALIAILIIFINWLQIFGKISMAIGEYGNLLLLVTASISGWILLKCTADIVAKNVRVKNILVYIGRNTLPIVFLHFIAFKPISAIYVYAKGLAPEMTASFPVISGVPDYMWIVYTVSGIAIPLMIHYIYKKIISNIERRI